MMKNITRYPILGMLFMLSSMVCTAQSLLHITSEERTRYQDEVKHFVKETYYGSLQEYIADDIYRDYIIEKMMLDSEAKYKPEFCSTRTSDRYLTPLQYLQELSRSYSGYEEGEISISVDEIDVSDSFFSHGLAGCYVEATYRISIQCSGKELQGGRCRMYCLFPNKAVRRDIRVLQVEPIMEGQAHVNVQATDSSVANSLEGRFSLEGVVNVISRYLYNRTFLHGLTLLIVLGSVIFWLYKKGSMESIKKVSTRKKSYRKSTDIVFDQAVDHLSKERDKKSQIPSTVHEEAKESLDEAIQLYRKKEYNEAVKTFLNYSNISPTAQCYLGHCYKYGHGVETNHQEAFKCYKKSAEGGNLAAQFELGECYFNGNGIDRDYSKAAKWYRIAAEKGYAFAQLKIANCYYYGIGVTQNYQEARSWYRLAAAKGFTIADIRIKNLNALLSK